MKVFLGGAWREINRRSVYAGGAWRRVTRRVAYISGAWRTVATFVQPLTVSISPSSASGFANPLKPSTQTVTTNIVTATPSGGLGPYTYLWSGGNTPTSASNSFTRSVPADSEIFDSFGLTVTDSLGTTAVGSVEATFTNQSQIG